MPDSDTLELIDLDALAQEMDDIPCEECEDDISAAKWSASHGSICCVYLLCDYHKQVLLAFLDQHPNCGHKHLHCKVCDADFGKNDVTICPLKKEG